MKAVVLWASMGALLAHLLTGCAHAPVAPTAPQAVLEDLLYYAEAAQAVTVEVCALDNEAKACQYLIAALDAFYARAVELEAAMNAGEDVVTRIRELAAEAKLIWSQAVSLLKGTA